MKLFRLLILGTVATGLIGLAWGCSGVDQIGPPDLEEYTTLVVRYGDPGSSPNPCNDVLPKLDGVAEDQEWSSAEPIFVRMTGDDGNGGEDYFLEVRAVWTNESRVGGSDRIFFLIRYPDGELNNKPDQLVYGTVDPVTGEITSSEAANTDGNPPKDPNILLPSRWTRIHRGGVEDQVMVVLTEVEGEHDVAGLPRLTGKLLPNVGFEVQEGADIGGKNTDVWVWRAGRTNIHPVYQYALWSDIDIDSDLPDFQWSLFLQRSGFCEDLWVDGSGALRRDVGLPPYAKNFLNRDPVPDFFHECPPSGRDPDVEDLETNAGIPVDLGLWWFSRQRLDSTTVLACSRVGRIRPWGAQLPAGDYDSVQGWGLVRPTESARDVRARGTFLVDQDKGFPVRTVEIMRDLNTGYSDDLVIDRARNYRIAIGVLNGSGQVGSGSTEIRLQFEAPKPRVGSVNRC